MARALLFRKSGVALFPVCELSALVFAASRVFISVNVVEIIMLLVIVVFILVNDPNRHPQHYPNCCRCRHH